jgi:hypothetical protein
VTSHPRSSGSNDYWETTVDKKKPTKAERELWEAQRAEMRANAQRTRELAKRAQAKLEARGQRG